MPGSSSPWAFTRFILSFCRKSEGYKHHSVLLECQHSRCPYLHLEPALRKHPDRCSCAWLSHGGLAPVGSPAGGPALSPYRVPPAHGRTAGDKACYSYITHNGIPTGGVTGCIAQEIGYLDSLDEGKHKGSSLEKLSLLQHCC